MMMMSNASPEVPTRFERGSGNVFADLGLPEPEVAREKAVLVQVIAERIEHRGLSYFDAGKLMDLDPVNVAAILRGRVGGFTCDQLTRCVSTLNDAEVLSAKADSVKS